MPGRKEHFLTERLRLRRGRDSDRRHLIALNADAEVMRYITAAPLEPGSPESDKAADRQMDLLQRRDGLGLWVVEPLSDPGRFLGWAGLFEIEMKGPEIELGYRFFPSAWGDGIASEASAFLVDYAFNTLQLDRVYGITHPDNLPSQRVLEKVGLDYVENRHYYGTDVRFFATPASI